MPYSRWEDAMVAQQRIKEFYDTRMGQDYILSFFTSMRSKYREHVLDSFPPELLSALQYRTVQDAEPVYVSADITDVIDEARRTFEPEVVLPGDPFCPAGFALLPRYVTISDMPRDEENPMRSPSGFMTIRAIAWSSVHSEDMSEGAHWISFYSDMDDDLDLDPDDHRYSRPGIAAEVRRHMPLSLVHQFQWAWGLNPWADRESYRGSSVYATDEESIDGLVERGKQCASLIQTMWRIGSQFVLAKHRAPRGIRRDYARRVKPLDDMIVVKLRRARTPSDHEPTNGDRRAYSVQFPVRGHWRNQWYATLGEAKLPDGTSNPASHRQVWIDPFMKGPEGAPVRMAAGRAWEFTR